MSDPTTRAAFHHKTQMALRRHNDAQAARETERTYRIWDAQAGTFTYQTESDAGLAPRPLELRFYHHYKGGLYYVLAIGIHTETEEELVFYQHVGGKFYARPMSSWQQKASVNRPPPIHRSQMYVERFRLLPADFKMVP